MILPNDLSKLDKRQLQDLSQQATEELLPQCNGDFVAANRRAIALYPQLFQAIKDAAFTKPDYCTPLDNAALATTPQPSEDNIRAFGLHPSATMEEFNAAWKASGNKCDPSKAPEVFSAIQDLAMKSQNLGAADAASTVSIRHPNLAKMKDATLVARRLQSGQPPVVSGSDTRMNRGQPDMSAAAIAPNGVQPSPFTGTKKLGPPDGPNPFRVGLENSQRAVCLENSHEPIFMRGDALPGGAWDYTIL